jgi:hypothetical protein
MPPPARLAYRLQRGGQVGAAVLDWQFGGAREASSAAGDAYRLSLGALPPGERWAWVSQGGFDGHGLAPHRYTDVLGGRERRAVNFQREAALVSWSASARQQALPAGLQDRASWLVQLASVLNAEPDLRQAGRSIELWVAGQRGELFAWRLQVRGPVALALPDGRSLPTLHVVHEPQRPWAPRIELWLDPRQGHLPARLSFAGRPPLEPLELLRDDSLASPPATSIATPSTPGS